MRPVHTAASGRVPDSHLGSISPLFSRADHLKCLRGDIVDAEISHAAMVNERAATAKAWRTPAVGVHHSILLTVGSSSAGVGRAEQRQAGYPQCCSQMHRSGIIGDQQVELINNVGKLSKI